jgi:two-component system, sensor histidine kinase and response regulator
VNPRTILVVDDEVDIRESLRDALKDEGYEVHLASNGQEALDLLPTLPRPCAVILDILMPIMNGADAFRAIRATPSLSDIPILVSTSDPSRAPPTAAVMKKPISLERLLASVDGLFTNGASPTTKKPD